MKPIVRENNNEISPSLLQEFGKFLFVVTFHRHGIHIHYLVLNI